eukprot:1801600-Prymnesium_polylepis.1
MQENATAGGAAVADSASQGNAISQLFGMTLAFAAAAVVAYSMVLQRFALAHAGPRVRMLNVEM